MDAAGTLTFWGVRGSIPAPGLHTITFGGNTSCVSVDYREHVIIFDAGSGLRQLGLALMAAILPMSFPDTITKCAFGQQSDPCGDDCVARICSRQLLAHRA